MNWQEFNELIQREYEEIVSLNQTKGKEYAGEGDALGHFKVRAEALGMEPEQVWAVLAGKHWESIMSFCREGEVQSTETIEGRINDLILYLLLLLGLRVERVDTANAQQFTPRAITDNPQA